MAASSAPSHVSTAMPMHPERQYLDLLQTLLDRGVERGDRTGTGTKSLFGHQMRFDLAEGFPLLTTKRVFFRGSVHEMLWFLSGSTNIQYLRDNGVTIWDEWADAAGELGPVYGKQWRRWEAKNGREIDQIAQLVEGLRNNPNGRRHIFTGWNVGELDSMALPPCHMTYQYYVADGKLSGILYQRSADVFLGVPFNICGAALLIHMLAQQCGLQPGELVWMGADVHLYLNHLDQAREQLQRTPRPFPQLTLREPAPASIFDYRFEDFTLSGYNPYPSIAAPVAI